MSTTQFIGKVIKQTQNKDKNIYLPNRESFVGFMKNNFFLIYGYTEKEFHRKNY
jgi:hypothetical protein